MSFVVILTAQNTVIVLKKLFVLIMSMAKFWRWRSLLNGIGSGVCHNQEIKFRGQTD
jgi:hypothetical protein